MLNAPALPTHTAIDAPLPESVPAKSRVEVTTLEPWQWRQMLLSEHAPAWERARIVALVIESYMSAEQHSAWPSQGAIATRAKVGITTVKRALKTLDEAGWISRSLVKREGQQWRLTTYSPVVPATLSDVVRQRRWHPDSDRGEPKPMASASNDGEANAMAPPSADVGPNHHGGESKHGGKVSPNRSDVRPAQWSTKSPSEASIGSLHPKSEISAASPTPAIADSAAPEESEEVRQRRAKLRELTQQLTQRTKIGGQP